VMSRSNLTDDERWSEWREQSRRAGEKRWHELEKIGDKLVRRQRKGKQWLADTRRSLATLSALNILQPHESSRVAEINFGRLAKSDQDRLRGIGVIKHLYAFAISADPQNPQQSLSERSLSLSPGKRLREGKLSLQVFVDDRRGFPLGMNIQLRGLDPARHGRSTYIRYDLDAVPMGESMGAVTHFNAHWHTGDDPDARDAEHHDPRLPSLILDPVAVIEFLIETFFPGGSADLT
jgi:hypothetical protein